MSSQRSQDGPKPKKRRTRYSNAMANDYPFIQKCTSSIADNEYKFHCTTCNVNLSCAYGGMSDVKDHVKTEKHRIAERNIKS